MTENIKRLARKVLSDLSALPEEGMRLELLGRTLSRLEPFDIARFVEAIYNFGPEIPGAVMARRLLINPEALKAALGDDVYRRTYLAAIRLGFTRVSRLFTDLPPHRKGLAGYDKEEEVKMEHTTLGERRALSKASVKDTIDRLLSDPDPMVITNLLNNPRLLESQVLKIASKRPGSPEILKIIAGHRKWSRRYAVKRAIASNPYSPPRIAIGLLEFLMVQDLKAISTDDTLHPQVRLSASEAVAEKTGAGREGGEGEGA